MVRPESHHPLHFLTSEMNFPTNICNPAPLQMAVVAKATRENSTNITAYPVKSGARIYYILPHAPMVLLRGISTFETVVLVEVRHAKQRT